MSREWDDAEIMMISALEHYSYCPRQCALIHVEQTFDENVFTLRGRRVHNRVDRPSVEHRSEHRIVRSLPLYSDRLGLVGRGDVVEFREHGPYPIEYKHGRSRRHPHAEIQLCAQAICLEEMTGESVPEGALYFAGSNRKTEVSFDPVLRERVERIVREVRELVVRQEVPPPVYDKKCRHCSLKAACQPKMLTALFRQKAYFADLFAVNDEDEPAASGPTN